MQNELPFRQIHLDFHTSEYIEGIGANFDPDDFADTLADVHVNSINIFARGHHGYLYYKSERFSALQHPHLTRDLLRDQIAACHARGIKTPIYVTVQWDHLTALQHPEWRVMKSDGSLEGTRPYESGFYRRLCLNTPYVDFLKEIVLDVLESLDGDGVWLDIVDAQDCSCWHCRQGMLAQGLNPELKADRVAFGEQVLRGFQQEMTAFIHGIDPTQLIFYNAGHVGPRHRSMIDNFTHLELESLPSGGWGYLHFPIAARYGRTLGKDYLGMTGKFQTSWGDFHSFKNLAALEFECFHMLALNAKCCVGDQLLPDGHICHDTYDLVGKVYEQVEAKEPWCKSAVPLAEIGLLTNEEFTSVLRRELVDFNPVKGAVRMLQEGAYQFDIIDSQADFSQYQVLVLPDKIPVDAALATKLDAFIAAGGSVIASFASGMDVAQTGFTWDALGVSLKSAGPTDLIGNLQRGIEDAHNSYCEYLLPKANLSANLPLTEHAMYMRGMEIAAGKDCQVLADTVASYFDRNYLHFISHKQTPSSGKVSHPSIVQNGSVIYFSNPVFSQYHTKAPQWCKQIVFAALRRLLPNPLVKVKAPSGTIVTLNAQPDSQRWVMHTLFYIPERRAEQFDVIEDVIPLYNVPFSILAPEGVESVRCVPQGEVLSFELVDGRVTFTLPKLEGHQMIELCWG